MFQPLPNDLAVALEAARARLGPYADVRFGEAVESTNDLALALAASGRGEGTSVVADEQRTGRGRRGRSWFSPAGAGLYVSVIVRPQMERGSLALITLAAGVAVAEAVSEVTGLPVELKWPNDLVIGRPWRKIGGILAEASTSGARIDAVVIGIGLNVTTASYPREIAERATSLETELGRGVERGVVLVALLGRLQATMTKVHAGEGRAIVDDWRRFGGRSLERQPVRWHDERGEQRGRACGIDGDGALLVDADGRVERIIAGEVTWEAWSRE